MNKNIIKTALAAMFAAISVVLVYVIRFPLIPAAPFLEYDPADIPVLISGLLMGPGIGLCVLLIACAVQALTVSAASGIIGFLMHFISSAVLLLTVTLIFRGGKSFKRLIIALVCGSLAMAAVMIPLNLIFTGIFMGTGVKAVASMLIPAIIPFNLLKAGINSAVTAAVYLPLKKAFDKIVKH